MAMKVLDIPQDDNVGARVGDKLKGRVAFATGGTRGIGAAADGDLWTARLWSSRTQWGTMTTAGPRKPSQRPSQPLGSKIPGSTTRGTPSHRDSP